MKTLRYQVGLFAALAVCVCSVSCTKMRLTHVTQTPSATEGTAQLTNSVFPPVAPMTSAPAKLTVQVELQPTNKITVPIAIVADAPTVIPIGVSVKVTNVDAGELIIPAKIKLESSDVAFTAGLPPTCCNTNCGKASVNPEVERCSCHRLLLIVVIFGIIIIFLFCQFGPIKPYKNTLEGISQRKKLNDVLERAYKQCSEDVKIKILSEDEAKKKISEAHKDGDKKWDGLQSDYDLTQHKRHAGKTPERVFTTACAIVAAIHLCVSGGKADYALLGLLSLAGVPWLRHIFKKIGLKEIEFWNSEGAVQVKEADKQQVAETKDETKPAKPKQVQPEPDNIPKVQAEVKPATESIIEANLRKLKSLRRPGMTLIRQEELKILATLWKYQNIHFKEDRTNRWTFTVGSQSPDYAAFSLGVLLLLQKDFVAVAPNGQIMLTDLGYEFCQRRDVELSTQTDIYDKFSN